MPPEPPLALVIDTWPVYTPAARLLALPPKATVTVRDAPCVFSVNDRGAAEPSIVSQPALADTVTLTGAVLVLVITYCCVVVNGPPTAPPPVIAVAGVTEMPVWPTSTV